MAVSIMLMDYLTMKAMQTSATMSHKLSWMIVSVIIAFIESYLSLFIFIHFRKKQANKFVTWLSAIIMSIAISGAHYAGMLATTCYVEKEQMLTPHTLLYEVIISIVILYKAIIFMNHYLLRELINDSKKTKKNLKKMHPLRN